MAGVDCVAVQPPFGPPCDRTIVNSATGIDTACRAVHVHAGPSAHASKLEETDVARVRFVVSVRPLKVPREARQGGVGWGRAVCGRRCLWKAGLEPAWWLYRGRRARLGRVPADSAVTGCAMRPRDAQTGPPRCSGRRGAQLLPNPRDCQPPSVQQGASNPGPDQRTFLNRNGIIEFSVQRREPVRVTIQMIQPLRWRDDPAVAVPCCSDHRGGPVGIEHLYV